MGRLEMVALALRGNMFPYESTSVFEVQNLAGTRSGDLLNARPNVDSQGLGGAEVGRVLLQRVRAHKEWASGF